MTSALVDLKRLLNGTSSLLEGPAEEEGRVFAHKTQYIFGRFPSEDSEPLPVEMKGGS